MNSFKLENFRKFYKNKRVLITGITGFKGSWLALWLLELGAEVIGYSLPPHTNPSLFNALNLKDKLTYISGNILDSEKLNQVFEQYKPEIVFHMAAQALVRPSYLNPALTFETNIMGTVNLFEAVRQSNLVRAVVNVTSDKCYENKEISYAYKEDDPMGGYDPYSASKGCAELVTASYRNSFFHPDKYGETHNVALASARAGNVIGGGDWAEVRLIPDFIRTIIDKKPITLRNPGSIRPWQFVLEPLFGYLMLAYQLYNNGIRFSGGWNFGPYEKDTMSVEAVISKVIEFWGDGVYGVAENSDLHEAKLLMLDINKSLKELNWKPVYNISEAVEETVSWYKAFYKDENIYDYSLSQLNKYISKLESTYSDNIMFV